MCTGMYTRLQKLYAKRYQKGPTVGEVRDLLEEKIQLLKTVLDPVKRLQIEREFREKVMELSK